ncbi:MAG TPA: hypothetical protein VGK40_01785 [Verrucomicrobiae bacterium]
MNAKRQLISMTLALAAVCGCSRSSNTALVFSGETLTPADAQEHYTRTRWFFTKPIFAPIELARSSTDTRFNSLQVYLKSTADTRIIYGEHVPDQGHKGYHGLGRLVPIDHVSEPVFLVLDRPAENSRAIYLAGFARERMVTVEAEYAIGTKDTVMADALMIATNSLAEIHRHFRQPP